MGSGSWVGSFAREESGAAGIEYGLIVAAISASIVIAAFSIGDSIANAFDFTAATILGEIS
ncbi:MAG TPA: Flp family type IVb pilin [Alphaproteobacteria bacterium]|nr:Flp family type IVb pilin [Alphaproteobacteria bacterium]